MFDTGNRYDPDRHHRRSIRLKGYDYAHEGAYFVTICVFEHECLLGEVVNGVVELSEFGSVVEREWLHTPDIRPQVDLDYFVIMPNHIHGILVINDDGPVGAYCNTPLQTTDQTRLQSPSQTVGAMVRGFKAAVTKRVNIMRESPGAPFWQRNYYEHIIRNEQSLYTIRHYVATNPARWAEDRYYGGQKD
ncbi:MAG: transposase [Chloroflexi bacterium]|nr:transposase [Chloroflexota bacterium]